MLSFFLQLNVNIVEHLLSDPLGRETIRLDNCKPKITGLKVVWGVGLRSKN